MAEERLYPFEDEEGKWGYTDELGNIVIKPQFDYAYPFSGGLAKVMIGDKFYYINKEGKIIKEVEE